MPARPDATTIRPARPADLPAVDALLALAYPVLLRPDYPPSVLVTALPLISRAKPELLASGTYHVVEHPEAGLIAAGGWTRAAPPGRRDDPAAGNVRHVVTHPDHLRHGHARRLIERSLNEARAAGCRRMDCLSTRTAVPFYAALGFEVLGPADVQLRPGITFPSVRMRAVL